MTRPPLLLLIAYRLFAWRLGPAYREWTYDDITRRGYTLRQAVPVALALGVVLAVLFEVGGSTGARAIPPVIGVLILSYFLRKALRERALRQQGLSPSGEPEAKWFDDEPERRRRNIVGTIATAVLVTAALAFLALGDD